MLQKNRKLGFGGLPAQKISSSKKTKEWKEQCVDAIDGISYSNIYNSGRSSRKNKQANYNLYNSILDHDDFKNVLDPIGVGKKYGEMPAELRSINKIRGDIRVLLGEEANRPFNYTAIGVGGEILNVKEEIKKQAVFQALLDRLTLQLGITQPQIDPNTGMEIPPPPPEQYAKFKEMSYKDIREVLANQILDYLVDKDRLHSKFLKGLEHTLITSEQIYYVSIHDGEPRTRVVNPLHVDFILDSDSEFVQNGQAVKEERWLTVGTVIDEFGEYLTDEEIDKIEEGNFNSSYDDLGFSKIEEGGRLVYDEKESFGSFGPGNNNNVSKGGLIRVATVQWKSMKKIGFLLYIDEDGNPQEDIVPEDFKLTKEQKSDGWQIEYRWITEVWQGHKVGDIYVNIEPLPNQNGKLSYIGMVADGLNSVATSLVDLLKPDQLFYNILWHKVENEVAKAKGSVLQIDTSKIPTSQGLTKEHLLYYLESKGVLWVNSMEEGKNREVSPANNMFTTHDLGASRFISECIAIMGKLEEHMSDLSGVSRQRKGQITSSETLGGVETSIYSSSNTTELYFYNHNLVKREVLTQLLELSQIAFIDGKKLQRVVDEIQTEMINVDGGLFNDSAFDVRLSNSTKDKADRQKLERYAEIQLQKGDAKFSDIISLVRTNSIAEISSIIRKTEKEAIERQESNLRADRETQAQISENQLQAQRERIQFEVEQNQLDRDNKVLIAQIGALSSSGGRDIDGDGNPDIVGQMKAAIDQNKANQKYTIDSYKLKQENDKIELEKQRLENDKIIKEKEIELKKQQSDNQLKIAKTNKNRYSK
jgi:hypothetical protein